jgi:hypothetical protein
MGMDGTIPLEDTNVTSSNVAGEVNPPTWSRRLTIASYLALFLLGLPYWWHTTSIERLPLPSAVSPLRIFAAGQYINEWMYDCTLSRQPVLLIRSKSLLSVCPPPHSPATVKDIDRTSSWLEL